MVDRQQAAHLQRLNARLVENLHREPRLLARLAELLGQLHRRLVAEWRVDEVARQKHAVERGREPAGVGFGGAYYGQLRQAHGRGVGGLGFVRRERVGAQGHALGQGQRQVGRAGVCPYYMERGGAVGEEQRLKLVAEPARRLTGQVRRGGFGW